MGLSRKKLYGIALMVIIVSATLVYYAWYSMTNKTNKISSPKVAILDGGAIWVGVNPFFLDNITKVFEAAGYIVDYYGSENVTVELFMNLPTLGYNIIIFRNQRSWTAIYTGEKYDQWKYTNEQLNGELENGGSYFAITAALVKNSMRGRFKNSTIIDMGCNSLCNTNMSVEFINRGAKVFIGWRNSQPIRMADHATELLISHLITEGKTIEQAVNETMKEKNTYPVLAYYPPEVGDTVITDEMFDVGFTPDYLMMLLQILIPVDIVGGIAVIVDVISRRRRKRKKAMARSENNESK
jgi:hypothetical protein